MFFLFQAEDGIRGRLVTGVQTCALPISAVKVQATTKKKATPKVKAKFKPDTKKRPTAAEREKKIKSQIPTKMDEGELEAEDTQDVLTEEEELLMAEQEKKRAQRKKKIAKLEKKIKKLGSDANRSLSKYLQEISRFEPLLRSEEHTSELQSQAYLVCRLLLETKKK